MWLSVIWLVFLSIPYHPRSLSASLVQVSLVFLQVWQAITYRTSDHAVMVFKSIFSLILCAVWVLQVPWLCAPPPLAHLRLEVKVGVRSWTNVIQSKWRRGSISGCPKRQQSRPVWQPQSDCCNREHTRGSGYRAFVILCMSLIVLFVSVFRLALPSIIGVRIY